MSGRIEVATPETEDKKQKRFYFRISDIQCNFDRQLDSAFLEFVVGGKTKEKESTEATEEKVITKKKGPDGQDVEMETIERVYKKRVQIIRGFAGRYFTRYKEGIQPKESVAYKGEWFVGEWSGTYDDLETELLEVLVWRRKWWGPNDLIGRAQCSLLGVAKSKVDREMDVESVGSSRARREVALQVKFKMEFQEKFDFEIELSDWEASEARKKDRTDDDDYDPNANKKIEEDRFHTLNFHLSGADLGCFARLQRIVMEQTFQDQSRCSLLLMNGATLTPERQYVHYQGTRSWLEDETLTIELLENKRCCGVNIWSKKIASKSLNLQGVLDHGYLMADLLASDGRKGVAKQALKSVTDTVATTAGGSASFLCTCLTCFLPHRDTDVTTKRKFTRCCYCFHCPNCFNHYCGSCVIENVDAKVHEASAAGERFVEAAATAIEKKATHHKEKKRQPVKGNVKCTDKPKFRQMGNVGRPQTASQWFSTSKGDTYLVVRIIRGKVQSMDDYKELLNPCVQIEWVGLRKTTRCVMSSEPFWDETVYFKIPGLVENPPKNLADFGETAMNSVLSLSVWDNEGLTRSPLGMCNIDFDTIYSTRVEQKLDDKSSVAEGSKISRWVCMKTLPLVMPSTIVKESDHVDAVKKENGQEVVLLDDRFLEFQVYFECSDKSIGQPTVKDTRHGIEAKPENPFNVKPTDEMDPTPMNAAQQLRCQVVWKEQLRTVPDLSKRFFAVMGKDELTGKIHFLPTFVRSMHPPTDIQLFDKLLYFVHCIEHTERPAGDDDEDKLMLRKQLPNIWVWSDPFFFLEKKRGDAKDHALLLCNFLIGLGMNAYVCIGSVRTKRSKNPQMHVWVMTLESKFRGDPKDKAAKDPNLRFVRFWEPSNGKVFELHTFETTDAEGNVVKKHRFAHSKQHDEEEKGKEEAKAKRRQLAQMQETVKKNKGKVSLAEKVAMATLAETEQPDVGELDIELKIDDVNVEDGGIVIANPSVFEAAKLSRVEMQRVQLREQRDHMDPLVDEQMIGQAQKKRSTPYETIDVVFNDHGLWGNLQSGDPEVISYALSDRQRWAPYPERNWAELVRTEKRHHKTGEFKPALTPFYMERTLATQDSANIEIQPSFDSKQDSKSMFEQLEDDITERIKSTIRSHREYMVHTDTEFYQDFIFTNETKPAYKYIRERLMAEESVEHNAKLARQDKQRRQDQLKLANLQPDEQEKEQVDVRIEQRRQDWINNVVESLDGKTKYCEKLLHFKHTDSNRISDSILESCKSMIEIPPEQNPVYGIGTKIEILPALVAPVRVFLCVTYTPPAEF